MAEPRTAGCSLQRGRWRCAVEQGHDGFLWGGSPADQAATAPLDKYQPSPRSHLESEFRAQSDIALKFHSDL